MSVFSIADVKSPIFPDPPIMWRRRMISPPGMMANIRHAAENIETIEEEGLATLQQCFVRKFATLEDWEQAGLARVATILETDNIDASPLPDRGDGKRTVVS